MRVIDAFWKLSTCRSLGMGGAGPIPWDAMHLFAHAHQFDLDQVEYDTFIYIMQRLDEAFLQVQLKESERKNKPPPNPGRRR